MNKRLCLLALALTAIAACATSETTQGKPTTPQGVTKVEVDKEPVAAKEAPPPSEAPRDIHFPPIERAQTQSGLELNTVALPELPLVQIELVINSGSSTDDPALPGLAQLTADMLKEGTTRKSSAKLAEAIEFLGASLDIHNDEESVYIAMRALSEHFDEALALVAEVATQPAFDQKELDKLKKREEARLALQSQDSRFLASRELHRVLYGEHPYNHVDTTLKVLKRVKRQDLQRWHRAHFAPNNAFLVVAGQVTPEQVKSSAETLFAKWKARKIPEQTYPAPPQRTQREVLIVDRPQSVQSVFYIGNLALPRKDDDYIPLLVANQVLGGSAASRLFMDLREKRSLTYGAYSYVDERVDVGPFIASAQVRNEVTGKAMEAFAEHLDRIVAEAPGAQELADAQRYLVDRFPLRIDTPGKIAGLIVDLRKYGLPDDYWDSFRGQITAVTPDAALAAARKHIKSDRSLIVVVGKAADIKGDLEKYGPVTVVDTDGELVVSVAAAQDAGAQKPAAEPKDKPAAPAAPAKDKSAPKAAAAERDAAAKPAAGEKKD